MINLIKVNEIGDDLIQEFKLSKEDQLYECQLDNIKIGYAIIRNEKNNKIFMVLAEKYQNNGYGSAIFKLLLSKINDSFTCSVPFENFKMQSIIQKNNGVEIGRNGKEISYIINVN